jgi:cytochrome c-type biogenesis protein CcmH/NrfF
MKKKRQNKENKSSTQRREPSYWMISTFVLAVLLMGLVAKIVFAPRYGTLPDNPIQQRAEPATNSAVQEVTSLEADGGAQQGPASKSAKDAPQAQSAGTGSLESKFRTVASKFKCGCGDCGDRLVECSCTDSKGAVEMKRFIRAKLGEDLSVDQVIDLVAKKYGNRIT